MAVIGGLESIVRHVSIKEQPKFGIRLWAAKAFAIAVEQGTIPPNEINPALRQLAAAAGQETRWLILRRQFEAMAAVDSKVSRDVQVEALATIVKQIGEDEAPRRELGDPQVVVGCDLDVVRSVRVVDEGADVDPVAGEGVRGNPVVAQGRRASSVDPRATRSGS